MITVDSLEPDFATYIPGSFEDNLLNACSSLTDGIEVEEEDLTALYLNPEGCGMYMRGCETEGTTIENCREFRSYRLIDSDMLFRDVRVVSLAYDPADLISALALVDLRSTTPPGLPSTYRGSFEALRGVFEVKCDYAQLKVLLVESEVILNAPDTHVVIEVRSNGPVTISGLVKSWEVDSSHRSMPLVNNLECS